MSALQITCVLTVLAISMTMALPPLTLTSMRERVDTSLRSMIRRYRENQGSVTVVAQPDPSVCQTCQGRQCCLKSPEGLYRCAPYKMSLDFCTYDIFQPVGGDIEARTGRLFEKPECPCWTGYPCAGGRCQPLK